MTLNNVKLECAVTFMKYLASVDSLIFLPETLIWNKTTFPALNLLNFEELVENELMKSISKKFLPIFPFLFNLSAYCKDSNRAYNCRTNNFTEVFISIVLINNELPVFKL